mmetsp:Transcript_17575/g.29144  ORF Transcript_17575/g.29144 Transcript_17575/m.29144 type:complete len:227 (+) Transcript_17575:43-723(+)
MSASTNTAVSPQQPEQKRRYMERKCLREKQRRNEFNQGLERLSEFLYQVEPSLQSGKNEGIDEAESSITNRSDLVNVTVRVISRLYLENEGLRERIEAKCVSNPSLTSEVDSKIPKNEEASAVSFLMTHPSDTICPLPVPLENSALAALIQQQRLQVLQMQQLQAVSANFALSQHPSILNSLEFAAAMPQTITNGALFNSTANSPGFRGIGISPENDRFDQDGSTI